MNIVAVSAKFQIVTGWTNEGAGFTSAYDDKWLSMGGVKFNEMLFELPTLPCSKPLSMIKGTHRRRARQKRNAKIEIYNNVIQSFGKNCLR
jgi:uncharacterized protein VirK/YbjX